MSALSDLFPKARAEILRLLFETGDQEIHLRDLARLAALSPAALQKELTSLAAKQLVLKPFRTDSQSLITSRSLPCSSTRQILREALNTKGIAARGTSNIETPNSEHQSEDVVRRTSDL